MNKQSKKRQEESRQIKRTGYRGKQGRKDSSSRRVNFDNERESKFDRDAVKALKEIDNAVSWYWRNPEMARSAASIGFAQTAGLPYLLNGGAKFMPGVFAIQFRTGLGNLQAVNQAKDSTYSFTVHANSRNTSYTSADQFMFIYAGKEAFMALAVGIRLYGVMRQYEQENAYIPDALIRAMGFTPSDVKSNYHRMLFDINQAIARAKQIWIPNEMPVIEREFWMCSHIYMDAQSMKAQYYLYVPQSFYMLSETGSEAGSSLVPDGIWNPNSGVTWNTYLNCVNTLLDALINSEDRGLIFGDILKAYGADKIYRVNEIGLDYTVSPVYDEEVLSQMSNATAAATNPANIIQFTNSGSIGYDTTNMVKGNIVLAGQLYPEPAILNMHVSGQPTPEQVMVATRMTTVGSIVSKVGGSVPGIANVPSYHGTEYATAFAIYTYTNNSRVIERQAFYSNLVQSGGDTLASIVATSVFDWAPTIYLTDTTYPTETALTLRPNVQDVYSDLENAIVITKQEAQRLHNAAVYSEWGVPISLS